MRAAKTTTLNVGHGRPPPKERSIVPVERVITRANAKAQSNSDTELFNFGSCVQCETDFVVGSSGSSESLCSECFVIPFSEEPSLKQKRKANSTSKSKKKSDKRKRSAKVSNKNKVSSTTTSPGLGYNAGEYGLDEHGVDSFQLDGSDNEDYGAVSSAQELPMLDEWLCDLSSFRKVREGSGDFMFSSFLLTGFIWAVIEVSTGNVVALFQLVAIYLKLVIWRVSH